MFKTSNSRKQNRELCHTFFPSKKSIYLMMDFGSAVLVKPLSTLIHSLRYKKNKYIDSFLAK